MQYDQSAFLTGIYLTALVVLDSVVVMLAAKRVGMTVQEVGIFFGKGIKRQIGNLVWKLGFLPIGSYVKIRGMMRDEDEEVEEGDFDQVSLGKRVWVMLVDKLVLAALLIVAILLLPGESFGEKAGEVWDFWMFVFGFADPATFPVDKIGNVFFPLAAVCSWLLLAALLPVGNTKTQRLLIEVLGLHKLKTNMLFNTVGILSGLAILVFVVIRVFQYVSEVNGEGSLMTWLSLAAGFVIGGFVVVAVIFLAGKPVPKATSPAQDLPPDTPSL